MTNADLTVSFTKCQTTPGQDSLSKNKPVQGSCMCNLKYECTLRFELTLILTLQPVYILLATYYCVTHE